MELDTAQAVGVGILFIAAFVLGVVCVITAQLYRRDDGISAQTWFNTCWNIGPKRVITDIKIIQVGPFPNPMIGHPPYEKKSRSRWKDHDNLTYLHSPVTYRLYVNGKMIDSFLTEERALEKAKQVAFFAECKRETRSSA